MNKYTNLLQNSPFSLVLSFFLLYLLGSYSFLNPNNFEKKMLNDHQQKPDAFLTQVTAFYLNKDGKLQTQFKSPRMWHYYQDNKTEFAQPYFLIYTKNTAPWHILALHGQAVSGIETVNLWDNVQIHQAKSKMNQELQLKTQQVTLHPNTQTANTNKPVLVIQPGYQMSAIGVQLSLQEEKINLLSQAKGEFKTHFLPYSIN